MKDRLIKGGNTGVKDNVTAKLEVRMQTLLKASPNLYKILHLKTQLPTSLLYTVLMYLIHIRTLKQL